MMDDLIRRQAAIDALRKEMPRLTTPDGCGQFDREIQIADEAFVDCMTIIDKLPAADAVPVVRCKDCRWGREVCGNIECFVDSNIPPEHHGYEWFCPNGERRTDE